MKQQTNVIPIERSQTKEMVRELKSSQTGMKMLLDIQKSLNLNPPKYGLGIKTVDRRIVKLSDLITTDDKGNSIK